MGQQGNRKINDNEEDDDDKLILSSYQDVETLKTQANKSNSDVCVEYDNNCSGYNEMGFNQINAISSTYQAQTQRETTTNPISNKSHNQQQKQPQRTLTSKLYYNKF
jgi:hypothetical protein